MSYPILYSATETRFDHNGVGILSACVSCEVTEEANGIFELAMQYPMDGIHYAEIADRAIIKAKADQFRQPQLFRVYAISKPMNGIVTALAEHISYDLSGIPVKPFSANSAPAALAGLKNNSVIDCPFEFWTDKDTVSKFSVTNPASIRSRLGGADGSILDVYGGEYEFDNYTVKLHNNRGENRGVSIRYGKNLTDIQQDQNCSSVATGIYPYWVDGDGDVLVELPEKIVNAPGTYNFTKIKTVDFSQEFESQPTDEQLRIRAEKYIADNDIGIPKVSMTVSFAQLEQYEEYKNLKLLERVSLFDTVNVEFPALRVSATAKAVKVVYDVLADRVKSVTLGSVRANIADTIVEQQKEMEKKPTKTDLERAKDAATSWLTNGKGYAYFRKDGSGNIVDILFMDTQSPATAVNVMRVGQSGIGFSNNGVNGPYESAWTIDGNFVADFITAGTLNAALLDVINLSANSITAGTLSSTDGKSVVIDLDEGEGTFTGSFQTVSDLSGGVLQKAILDYSGLSIVGKYQNTGEERTSLSLGNRGLFVQAGYGTINIEIPHMRSDEEGDRGGQFSLTETDVGSVSMGVRGNVYPAEDDTTPKAYLDLQNEVDGTKFSILLQNGNVYLTGRNNTNGQGFYFGIDYGDVRLRGLTEPIDASDAVNKEYVDGKFLGRMRLLTSEDDCNNIKDDGVYWYSTDSVPKNAPFANAAIIEVYGADNNSSQKIQRGTRYGAGGYSATRALYNNNWCEWYHYALTTNGVIPISMGGTGGTSVATAQAALHVNQDYLFSQLNSEGDKSLSGIKAYPTKPGVYRVTTGSANFGVPGDYGCLVVFAGGGYYMHLYVNADAFWTARTTSMTAPTWKKMAVAT